MEVALRHNGLPHSPHQGHALHLRDLWEILQTKHVSQSALTAALWGETLPVRGECHSPPAPGATLDPQGSGAAAVSQPGGSGVQDSERGVAPLVSVAPTSHSVLTPPLPPCPPPTPTLSQPSLTQPPHSHGGPCSWAATRQGQTVWRGPERHILGRAVKELQAAGWGVVVEGDSVPTRSKDGGAWPYAGGPYAGRLPPFYGLSPLPAFPSGLGPGGR